MNKKTIVASDASDMVEAIINRESAVIVSDTHITINVAYPYEIPRKGCQTTDQILAWIVHLCEKTWITPDVLRDFAFSAASAAKIELPHV